jgi:beta-glucosidase
MPLPDLDTLTLTELVAQMVVVRASGYLFDHQIQYPAWEPPAAELRYLIENIGVGGVIFLGGSAGELAIRSQQVQNWAKIPLLVAADIEEGVGQRFSGATWFPPPMAIGAVVQHNPSCAQDYATQMGAITAQEALAIGINWVLAPVVDVNNNPDNPVINVRAFGETPEQVSQLATAFIRGAQNYPVLTTAKHFPGHGDTATDSHLDLPVLSHSPARLAEIELPPFEAAIASHVDAVMSAHLLIPSWDDKYPATLSERILTQQLRKQLGFQGLIVTDALVMGAITNRYGANEAPVLALEAGADILLMPVDPLGAIKAVCAAVESDRIPKERIRDSVERIWEAKRKVSGEGRVGANRPSVQEKADLILQLAQPSAFAVVENILRASQVVHGAVPLQILSATESQALCNLIVVDEALGCDFLTKQAPAIAFPTLLGYTTRLCDLHTPVASYPDDHQPTLLQLFIRGNPFRGSAGLTQVAQAWTKKLLTLGNLQALVVYGSPYVLDQLLPVLPKVPCVFSYGQMPTAQKIVMQTLLGRSTSLP